MAFKHRCPLCKPFIIRRLCLPQWGRSRITQGCSFYPPIFFHHPQVHLGLCFFPPHPYFGQDFPGWEQVTHPITSQGIPFKIPLFQRAQHFSLGAWGSQCFRCPLLCFLESNWSHVYVKHSRIVPGCAITVLQNIYMLLQCFNKLMLLLEANTA